MDRKIKCCVPFQNKLTEIFFVRLDNPIGLFAAWHIHIHEWVMLQYTKTEKERNYTLTVSHEFFSSNPYLVAECVSFAHLFPANHVGFVTLIRDFSQRNNLGFSKLFTVCCQIASTYDPKFSQHWIGIHCSSLGIQLMQLKWLNVIASFSLINIQSSAYIITYYVSCATAGS